MVRRCVWSRNLKNEEAMAYVGQQRHRGGGEFGKSVCEVQNLTFLRTNK